MDHLSTIECVAHGATRFRDGYDPLVGIHGHLHRILFVGIVELYRNGNQPQDQRNVDDPFAIDSMGVFCNSDYRCDFIPRVVVSSTIVDYG